DRRFALGSPSDEGSWFVVRGSRSRFGELFSQRMRLFGFSFHQPIGLWRLLIIRVSLPMPPFCFTDNDISNVHGPKATLGVLR
ncbi:hypothetical protein GALMADRAFT_241757, partial [Galerina marginata CBS 339.88]